MATQKNNIFFFFLLFQNDSLSRAQQRLKILVGLYKCTGWSGLLIHLFVFFKRLGPVVQRVVSLTSSLRVISLTVLADSIYNILVFFAEKM